MRPGWANRQLPACFRELHQEGNCQLGQPWLLCLHTWPPPPLREGAAPLVALSGALAARASLASTCHTRHQFHGNRGNPSSAQAPCTEELPAGLWGWPTHVRDRGTRHDPALGWPLALLTALLCAPPPQVPAMRQSLRCVTQDPPAPGRDQHPGFCWQVAPCASLGLPSIQRKELGLCWWGTATARLPGSSSPPPGRNKVVPAPSVPPGAGTGIGTPTTHSAGYVCSRDTPACRTSCTYVRSRHISPSCCWQLPFCDRA